MATTPVQTYGSQVKDASGKVVGLAVFDPNTGKPLTGAGEYNPNDGTKINYGSQSSSSQSGSSSSSQSSPSLIVTSNASRANYTNNLSNLQATTNNLSGNNNQVIGKYNNVDIKNGSQAEIDAQIRKINATQPSPGNNAGGAAQNPQSGSASIPVKGQEQQPVKYGDQVIGQDGKPTTAKFDASTGLPLNQTNSQATDPATPGMGDYAATEGVSTDGTDDDSSVRDAIDPTLRGLYDKTTYQLDQGIKEAKDTLNGALQTLQNDPAATTAVNMIMAKYDQQISAMKEKNKLVLASAGVQSARSGQLQYANEMDTNFMSAEQDRASARVADIITTETQMVLKAQQSYKDGNVKAFSAASKALKDAQKEKIDAVTKLLDETSKIVKQKQADAKTLATTQKQEVTDNIRVSTAIAATVAEELRGVKNQKDIDTFLKQMADENGITNPEILRSAVVKAQQTQTRQDILNKNTQSVMARRAATPIKGTTAKAPKAPKTYTDGSYTYSGDDVSTYTNFMNKGGTSPTGQKYNGRGSDGYVDPGVYSEALNDWVKNGGTPTGFAKKFPVKGNVNPDSYSKIPAAVRPSTKSTSSPA